MILSLKVEVDCGCQVSETATNVGRMSMCTADDASYKETANHCETLLMGKQKKMSNLISALHKPGPLMAIAAQAESQTTGSHVSNQHKVLTLSNCHVVSYL